MDRAKVRVGDRKKRASRVRKTVRGTSERPRLAVRRSLAHIYAQIIDDDTGRSLAQVGSLAKDITEKGPMSKGDRAKAVGEIIAKIAVEQGVKSVVFDRKGYPYHGRIKALADAARSNGLQF